ncbi:hypothetical protein ACJJTC_001440 [Scirpophaga incertulas]
MIVDRPNNKLPEVTKIANCDVVQSYIYLGAQISNRGGCADEIKRRMAIQVQGSVEGTRACGRSPMRWTEEAAVDGSLYECTWRAAVQRSDEGLSSEPPNPDLTTTTTLPRV